MFFSILQYIFAGLFVLFFFGFCIFIHELGHFLAAKWRRMHIVAFSIGFKKIWGFRHKGIEYRIGCLPFGGYVDIPQLDSTGEVKDKEGKVLPKVSPINRIIVAFAGPLFNVFFGLVLGTFLWIYGIPQSSPRMSNIKVAQIQKNSPEYKAGLRKGDKIITLNGEKFYSSWNKIQQDIIFTIGKVKLGIKQQDGSVKTISYMPAINPNSPFSKEGLPSPFFAPEIPIVIHIEPGSEAAKNGFRNGDRILKVNGHEPLDYISLLTYIAENGGKKLTFTVQRNSNKTVILKNISPKAIPNKKIKRYLIGVYPVEENNHVMVSKVSKNSAAEEAGILKGDIILSLDDRKISTPGELINIITKTKDKPLLFKFLRENKVFKKTITPRLFDRKLYYIPGISVVFYNHINPIEQFLNVIDMSYQSIRGIFSEKSKIQAKHLSGPIGIIAAIGTTVYYGSIINALNIVTIITFCLAIMNLLPLPILDGGHILISIIEIIIRRRLPAKLMQPICLLFAILLIALMLFATFNDVNRLTKFGKLFSSGKKEVNNNKTLKTKPNSP